jgi:cytochrome oxidase assembly protein ShyY1
MLDAVSSALRLKNAAPLSTASAADSAGYAWASGPGRFPALPTLLLDNQRRGDAVGVHVFAIFQPDHGEALLVDLGWLPLQGDRKLPDVRLPAGEQTVAGLLTPPPSPGFALGPAYVEKDPPGPAAGRRWLLTRVDLDALSKGLRLQLSPRVLRLDPALPIGYTRDLDVLPNTLPPERHRGYALQWFGLALAMVVITLLLGFRRQRK